MTTIPNCVPYAPHPEHKEIIYINASASVKRHIVCAANRYGTLIIPGVRHYDGHMRRQIDAYKEAGILTKKSRAEEEQGFLDQYGYFVTREDALYIVKQNHQQLRNNDLTDELYSEDLY